MKCQNKGEEIQNAKISDTRLGYEDHGILTVSLTTESDPFTQGFGGYALDSYRKDKEERVGTEYGMQFVISIMRTLEVENWEDVRGQLIRIDKSHNKIHGIGHLLKDKWFYPDDDPVLKQMADEWISKNAKD